MPKDAYTTTTSTSKKIWSSWRSTSFNKNGRVIQNLAATVVFWGVWRERNNRIFNELARSSGQTFHICLLFISYWLNPLSGTSRKMGRQALDQRGHLQQHFKGASRGERRQRLRLYVTSDIFRLLIFGSQIFHPDFCYRCILYFVSWMSQCYWSNTLSSPLYFYIYCSSGTYVCKNLFIQEDLLHCITCA